MLSDTITADSKSFYSIAAETGNREKCFGHRLCQHHCCNHQRQQSPGLLGHMFQLVLYHNEPQMAIMA